MGTHFFSQNTVMFSIGDGEAENRIWSVCEQEEKEI